MTNAEILAAVMASAEFRQFSDTIADVLIEDDSSTYNGCYDLELTICGHKVYFVVDCRIGVVSETYTPDEYDEGFLVWCGSREIDEWHTDVNDAVLYVDDKTGVHLSEEQCAALSKAMSYERKKAA